MKKKNAYKHGFYSYIKIVIKMYAILHDRFFINLRRLLF